MRGLATRCSTRVLYLSVAAAQSGPDKYNTDRKSTRLNSSHTVIYTLSLHDALPICLLARIGHARVGDALLDQGVVFVGRRGPVRPRQIQHRSEEHTSELQSHSDLHSFPTRRSSDLPARADRPCAGWRRAARPGCCICRSPRPSPAPTNTT